MPPTKESKTSATIRRRRNAEPAGLALSVLRALRLVRERAGQTSYHTVSAGEGVGPLLFQELFSSDYKLFTGLLIFRLLNAFLIQTWFVPDEYWQSVEVAHRTAFGYGHLTWEWTQGIRSFLYPCLFTAIFKVLDMTHTDYLICIRLLPRILHCVGAAATDITLYKVGCRFGSSQRAGQWVLACNILAWFVWYCCTRTLTNTVESMLLTFGIYYIPFGKQETRTLAWQFVALVVVSVMVRPTAGIVWMPLCLIHMWHYRNQLQRLIVLYGTVGVAVFYVCCWVDRLYYGKWLLTVYNFFEFNVWKDLGSFYGTHPWYWYLTQGLPVVVLGHFLPFIVGLYYATDRRLFWIMVWTLWVFSIPSHKEFRFLLPILPIVMIYSGIGLNNLDSPECRGTSSEEKLNSAADISAGCSKTVKSSQPQIGRGGRTCMKTLVIILLVTNVPLALYMGLIHQRGVLDVMRYLQLASVEARHSKPQLLPSAFYPRILFLMPCHSTPYYSHLHVHAKMRFLTCEPNLNSSLRHVDEADAFYESPLKWLHKTYSPQAAKLPHLIVMFDGLQYKIGKFLNAYQYRTCAQFFHTHFPEGRIGRYVIVKCRGIT